MQVLEPSPLETPAASPPPTGVGPGQDRGPTQERRGPLRPRRRTSGDLLSSLPAGKRGLGMRVRSAVTSERSPARARAGGKGRPPGWPRPRPPLPGAPSSACRLGTVRACEGGRQAAPGAARWGPQRHLPLTPPCWPPSGFSRNRFPVRLLCEIGKNPGKKRKYNEAPHIRPPGQS